MPKQVDHDLRRRSIVEALWRIAAESGLEAASLNQIATEAGVSKGMLQHYFSSKEELLLAASGYLRERVERRLERVLGGDGRPRTPREALCSLLSGLLPLDADSRTEALVDNAFFIRALNQPDLADRFHEGRARLRDLLADHVRAGQRGGQLHGDLDPRAEADLLLALVGGLGEAVLLGEHTSETAHALLDYHLGRMVDRADQEPS